MLCVFLSSAHLLRNLQPTNIKDLAQTMAGRECASGDVVYWQGDPARHFYLVLAGEVAMYETDSSRSSNGGMQGQQQDVIAGSSSGGGGKSMQHEGTSRSGSGSGTTTKHHRAVSSSKAGSSHTPSPRVRTAGGNASAGIPADVVEVRRVGPREAFGEDDIQAGSKREQTAVAGGANSTTFAALASSAGAIGASGGAAAASAAGGDSSRTRALLETRRRTMGNEDHSHGGAGAPPPGVVLLQLSADDYGAALEGRLSAMLEQKVGCMRAYSGVCKVPHGMNHKALPHTCPCTQHHCHTA